MSILQSYKAIKFYEKQTDDEIKKIAHVFSEKATFITNDNIYVLFLYSPDVYISNQNTLVLDNASFLLMTDYKFLYLLKNKNLGIQLNNIEMEFENGDKIDDSENEFYLDRFQDEDIGSSLECLRKERIHFNNINYRMKNNQMIINKYGTFSFRSRKGIITSQVIKIVRLLFEGK